MTLTWVKAIASLAPVSVECRSELTTPGGFPALDQLITTWKLDNGTVCARDCRGFIDDWRHCVALVEVSDSVSGKGKPMRFVGVRETRKAGLSLTSGRYAETNVID